MSYQIIYSPTAKRSLRNLSAWDRATVVDKVGEQLRYQPEEPTRQRKELKPNKLGLRWELRVGHLRIFYKVESGAVDIVLIGEKRGNEVYVDGEKLEL